uniref:Uncharacterized protein n=1 Tax=Anguilla anguilla TaxID=7936 RepID=A0A0E9Q5G2_ANGAN
MGALKYLTFVSQIKCDDTKSKNCTKIIHLFLKNLCLLWPNDVKLKYISFLFE